MSRFARSADLMTGLFLLALAALTFWEASDLPMGSAVRMGAGYVPRLLSFLMGGFGLAIIVLSFSGDEEPMTRWGIRPLLCVLLVPIIFALTIESLGLVVTVILCTIVAALGSRESRAVEVALLGIALALFTLALFVITLDIPMQPFPAW